MKILNFKNLFCMLLTACLVATFSCDSEPIDSTQSEVYDRNSDKGPKGPRANLSGFDTSQICEYSSTNLYAGQNILVGEVSVEENGENYVITYNLYNNDYCITETHLSVVNSPEDFPLNGGGNPKIGHFEYSGSHDCVSSVEYVVPISEGPYVAAHAVVNCVEDESGESSALSLPDQVDVCVTEKGVPESYFEISIAEGNSLSGIFDAWCVDQDAALDEGDCFTGDVYSSYEDLPVGQFENPQNFGAVNWLLNQNLIGTEASPELGNFTFGDIQIAIWNLVDDSVCVQCLFTGPFDDDRIDMLVNMALENNNYVPGCGENLAIIIVPTNGLQSILISIPIPCEPGDCDETAWAEGCDFPGNNWAMYFQYAN